MSRIGNRPVQIPAEATVTVEDGRVRVKGPKGELTQEIRPEITVEVADGEVRVGRTVDARQVRALHGLTRALIANMVTGVIEGYRKALEIVGVGYRVQKKGSSLVLNVGYSHPVEYPEPDGIELSAPSNTRIVVEGPDKQQVGQVAAELRAVRPPEPYKGKGIKYEGEHIRRKAGKAGA